MVLLLPLIVIVSPPIHQTRISPDMKKKRQTEESSNDSEKKRSRRSTEIKFDFKKDCLFCGEHCQDKDPKNPNRWKEFYIVRSIYTKGWVPFKDFILSICTIRNDAWSVGVRFRVDTAVSDLHAADARYRQYCKTKFLHSKYVDQIASQITTGGSKIDIGLESVKTTLKENPREMWNSVELYNLYSEHGGYKLSRRALVKLLVEIFGDEVVLLSSPGVASLLVFKRYCHFALQSTEDSDDRSLRIVAEAIKKETRNTDRNQYKVQFDRDTVTEGFSDTLMDLFGELSIGKLPSILIGKLRFIQFQFYFSCSLS